MRIIDLIRRRSNPFLSFEFFPPAEEANLPAFYTVAECLSTLQPLFVSVTYGAGGSKQDKTLAVTAELVQRGLTTMAHLTCVGATQQFITDFLRRLSDVGVENILALRGDPPQNQKWDWKKGRFQHASDLVSFIRLEQPKLGIGVAAYPTPHPEAPTLATDRFFTAQKIQDGSDFAITQLFFDVREYFALADDLKKRGVEQPIIPGILPIQSFASLRRVLSLSGASIPGKFYLALEEADQKGGAEAVRAVGLDFATQQIKRLLDNGVPGIHLYTLNKAELCLQLAERTGLKP